MLQDFKPEPVAEEPEEPPKGKKRKKKKKAHMSYNLNSFKGGGI